MNEKRSAANKRAWSLPKSRDRQIAARKQLYFKRYPWLPASLHDEMKALVKKVGRAAATEAMKASLKNRGD